MGNAAKAGVGAAALGTASAGIAAAGHADASYSDSKYEDANEFGYGALTAVQIVKFALLLERLEARFYTEAVGDAEIQGEGGTNSPSGGRLSGMDIENSAVAKQFDNPSMRYSMFVRFKQIRDHEQTHVAALEGVLEAVGADPKFASDVESEFSCDSFSGFLDLARAFETPARRPTPPPHRRSTSRSTSPRLRGSTASSTATPATSARSTTRSPPARAHRTRSRTPSRGGSA